VRERCKRKAAGLTLIKPGDIPGDLLAGKKTCYTCIARALIPPSQDAFEIRWLLIAEIAVFITLAASLPITGLLGIDRTIPAILLLLSITFFLSECWIRRAKSKQQ